MKTGIELIADERQRQMSVEGWTMQHDDTHEFRELARAAECYIAHYRKFWWLDGDKARPGKYNEGEPGEFWPWSDSDFKPKSKVCDLVRAGALIAAEIDRLHRIAQKPTQTQAEGKGL